MHLDNGLTMHNIFPLLDGHDHYRLRYISAGNHLGEMVRRMIRHAFLFRDVVLPQLEVPLHEGEKQERCYQLHDEEKEMLKALAAQMKWTQVDLVRALIFYYWKVNKSYILSLPKLVYGKDPYIGPVNWAPDRPQPWYSSNAEALDKMEADVSADMSVFIRILRENKVKEKVIQKVLNKWDYVRQYREGYYLPGDTPAALQQEVAKAELHRPGYWSLISRKRW